MSETEIFKKLDHLSAALVSPVRNKKQERGINAVALSALSDEREDDAICRFCRILTFRSVGLHAFNANSLFINQINGSSLC